MENKTENNKLITSIAFAVLVIVLIAVIIIRKPDDLSSLSSGETRHSEFLMGTMVDITLKGDRSDEANLAFAEIKRLENLFSSYKEDSDITKINNAPANSAVKVSKEVFFVLDFALEMASFSSGLFDPTIGAMKDVWSFSGELTEIPSDETISKALKKVDYNNLELNKENFTVTKLEDGIIVNLGGVAKGYIVGEAIKVLKEQGLKYAIVKAGGDLFILNEDGEDITVGIKHPRPLEFDKELYATITISKSGAVTTSGDYERFFLKDDKRYHHIINPKTGRPALKSQGATVFTANPMMADALSTTFFIMGYEKGIELAEALDGVEALIIDYHGNGHYTKAMKPLLTF